MKLLKQKQNLEIQWQQLYQIEFLAISIILSLVNLNASVFLIKVVMSLNKIPFLG